MNSRDLAAGLCAGLVLALALPVSAVDFPSPVQGGGPTSTVSGAVGALRRTDSVCVLPGTTLTLDAGLQGEDHLVSDCGGTVSSTATATVLPPAGETILGAASYVLSVPGQSVSFRRTAFGWVPH